MKRTMLIEENLRIPMRDGIHLSADLYRPDDDDSHPVIFMRAYSKYYGQRLPFLDELIEAGYCFVISDLRGRGQSEGEWNPQNNFTVEGVDGYDSVEWIAGQPWCDGNVGMYGVSHAACFAWLTAVEQPPHLKAIAPWTGDFNEQFVPPYTGGVISLITTLMWLPNEAADTVRRMEQEGHDVTEMREVLSLARNNPGEVINYLPFKDVPLARFGKIRELLNWRLSPVPQPVLDEYRRYDKITVPVFHECGWYDGAGWSQFENFIELQSQAGSELSRDGQYMVCGPWAHGMIFQNTLGQINFGFRADNRGSGLHRHQIAFFDKYLRGKDIELPKIHYFVMGKNEWRSSNQYPLPQTQWTRFYLHSNGNANTADGDGVLSTEKPGDEPVDRYLYDPHQPVPTTGGPLIGALTGSDVIAGPIEQYHIEKRHDVLCYTTAPFEEDTEITGALQIHLYASSSACDTDFAAKLVHVYPDGRAYNLAEGIIRASGRNFGHQPEPIQPHEIYEFVITPGHTSQHFPRGHRIRIDITSSNYPLFDRNMNTGNKIGEDAEGIVAMQSIYHDADHPSYIDLPVIPVEGS